MQLPKRSLIQQLLSNLVITLALFYAIQKRFVDFAVPPDSFFEPGPVMAYSFLVMAIAGVMFVTLIWSRSVMSFMTVPIVNWLAISTSACSYVVLRMGLLPGLDQLIGNFVFMIIVVCNLLVFFIGIEIAPRFWSCSGRFSATALYLNFLCVITVTLLLSL